MYDAADKNETTKSVRISKKQKDQVCNYSHCQERETKQPHYMSSVKHWHRIIEQNSNFISRSMINKIKVIFYLIKTELR